MSASAEFWARQALLGVSNPRCPHCKKSYCERCEGMPCDLMHGDEIQEHRRLR